VSDEEKSGRTEDEPEVEGHRVYQEPEKAGKAAMSERDDGPEVEGHRLAFGPEKAGRPGKAG
jgi:hypothetical protein